MSDFLKYENIGISKSAVWESKDGRIVEQYEHAQVLECALERGSPEQRPEVSAVLGAVLVIPGFFFVNHTYLLVAEGKVGNLKYEAAMFVVGVVGVWLVLQAVLSKRYFLRVRTTQTTRKLIFSKTAKRTEIEAFLQNAHTKYGFQVRNRLP